MLCSVDVPIMMDAAFRAVPFRDIKRKGGKDMSMVEEGAHRQARPILHARDLYLAHLPYNDADIIFPTTCQCCLDEGMGRL